MSPDFIQQLKKKIAKDKLEEVITMLQNGEEWIPDSAKESIHLLSGRLIQLRQKEMRGVIATDEALLELNKIRNALFQIIQTYAKTPEEQAKLSFQKRMKWFVPLLIYLLLTGGLMGWFFQPQTTYRIAAELLVERVSFRYLEGPTNLAKGSIKSCHWQNYKSVELEGAQIWLAENDNPLWEQTATITSPLTIKADENVPGLGIRFGPARLEKIYLESGAWLTFSQSENQPSLIQMSIQQAAQLKMDWAYRDSLDLELEMAQIEGISGLEMLYAPTRLRIFPPPNMAREIKIQAFGGTTNVDMHFEEEFEMEGKNLLIADPTFYQPLESVAVPTILSGTIQHGVLDRPPLKTINLSEGEALDILADQNLSLQKISFEENGIRILFTGEVQKVETGRSHSLRNPTRLAWWWHSQKMLLITLVIVLIGAAVFLLVHTRKGIL